MNVPLYNAMSLLSEAISLVRKANNTPPGGNQRNQLARAISNMTFPGVHGEPIRTNLYGDVIHYYYLLDYNSRQNTFESVLQMSLLKQEVELLESGASISWPNGRVLQPDICDFESCESKSGL